MSKRKIDSLELLRRIIRIDDDLLEPSYPRAFVDEELREVGSDPEKIGAEGEAFVKKLIAERGDTESRKASRTRLRSPAKAISPSPPAKARLTDPVEPWKALQSIGQDDMPEPEYPDALVDEGLREADRNPEEVGREGEAFVEKLLAERAQTASRKASSPRVRSSTPPASFPPAETTLPPVRSKVPSETGPINEE